MGGRKKDSAGDRRLAKSKMMAAAAADDVAARRARIGMVELLYWHCRYDVFASIRSRCCLRCGLMGWRDGFLAGSHT